MKICTKCGLEKPFYEFGKHSMGSHGLRPRCKSCTAEDNLLYRQQHKEHIAAYNKRYRTDNREHHLAYNKAWNARNPLRMRAMWLNHRARRVGKRTKISPDAIVARVAFYGGCCYYCGEDGQSIDHRIPLSRGGLQVAANLVPCCLRCNSSKGQLTEREFLETLRRRASSSPRRS